MRIFGSNHRLTPPSQLQEALACKEEIFARLLQLQTQGRIRGAALLVTCNRLEIILDTDSHGFEDPNLVGQILAEHGNIALHDSSAQAATHHLLRISTGLESMVRGEDQILGQVREAFKHAERHGLLSPALRVLQTKLLAAARETRRRAGLAKCKVSVASLAARQLEKSGRRFVVVGAGETGRLAIEALVKRGYTDLLVVNRTLSRAQALADHFGIAAQSLADFLTAAERGPLPWDGILFAVHSTTPFFHARHTTGLRVVVDVSLPSVFDFSVRKVEELEVLDLDAIAGLVEAEGESRRSRLKVATELVKARAQDLHQSLSEACSGANTHLSSIVDQHLETATQELDELLETKLSHLAEADQEQVRRAILRTTKRNAHLHLKHVRELSRP